MSIELKVGEWYETRSGVRVKVAFDTRGIGTENVEDSIIVVFRDGSSVRYFPCGGYLYLTSNNKPANDDDIVKHLEGCTGWDWKEPKPEVWRDAKPEDALREPPLRCRVKDYVDTGWSDRHRVLVGYINPTHAPYPWASLCDGAIYCYRYCQVLDE